MILWLGAVVAIGLWLDKRTRPPSLREVARAQERAAREAARARGLYDAWKGSVDRLA